MVWKLNQKKTGYSIPWFGNVFETKSVPIKRKRSSRFDRHMYRAITSVFCALFTFGTGVSYSLKASPPWLAKSGLGASSSFLQGVSSGLLDSDPDTATTVRKWHFLSQKSRADDVYVSQSGGDMVEVATEVWKSVLVSLRVLERLESESHDALIVLPKMPLSEDNHTQLRSLSKVLEKEWGARVLFFSLIFFEKLKFSSVKINSSLFGSPVVARDLCSSATMHLEKGGPFTTASLTGHRQSSLMDETHSRLLLLCL